MRAWVAAALLLLACKDKSNHAPPPAAPAPVRPAAPPTPVAAPLDPVRVEAEKGNRDALDRMSSSIQCPQKLPSQFTRFCLAATDFPSGNAEGLSEGDTLLIGEAAIIQPGPPGVSTLGTGMPVLMLLHREGASVSAKQHGFREIAEPDALPIVLARIGKVLDGTWDHVEVPAGFADQIATLRKDARDPLDLADGAYWPADADGMELRHAKGRWIVVGSPDGPQGRHVIAMFSESLRVLAPGEKSTQTIKVLHL